MLNSLCRYAETVGITFLYDADVTDIEMEDGFCNAISVNWEGNQYKLKFKQVITAAGGFEADLDWFAEGWVMLQRIFGSRHTL